MEFSQYNVDALMFVTPRPEIVFTEGKGMWLTDHNGKRYLDYLQGWAVNCLGHSPEVLSAALTEQAHKLLNPSPAFYNDKMIELADLLTRHSCFDKVFFTSTGAEANEGAVKLARKWGQLNKNGAFEIITFDSGFHGRTLAMMSASGKPGWDVKFAPQVNGFPKAELNDLASVEKLINANTVAVMLEPVQGEGGVIPASVEFMQALRELTHKHNILLIVDEVQTGMGRTGKLFGYQHSDIKPDIMTLAKGIGGGAPLGALLSTKEVACFVAGDQGGTYCGAPLMAAVGVAVTKELTKPGFLDEVTAMGDYLSQQLLALSAEFGMEGERGTGLLRALKLGQDIGEKIVDVAREMQPIGLLINSPRPNLLRFMPALNVTKAEIDTMISMLRQVILQVKATV